MAIGSVPTMRRLGCKKWAHEALRVCLVWSQEKRPRLEWERAEPPAQPPSGVGVGVGVGVSVGCSGGAGAVAWAQDSAACVAVGKSVPFGQAKREASYCSTAAHGSPAPISWSPYIWAE